VSQQSVHANSNAPDSCDTPAPVSTHTERALASSAATSATLPSRVVLLGKKYDIS
jgi:hypothetical protein